MLVSVDQLVAYMGGIKLTDVQRNNVETVILPGIQGELERHLNRPVERVHMRERRQVDDRGYVVFTVSPVWFVNFIQRNDGTQVTLPALPVAPDNFPDFIEYGGMRNINTSGDNSPGMIGLPYEYYVGIATASPFFPLTLPLVGGETWYMCDYIGGGFPEWDEKSLVLDITRVAAREVESQFDDTMSLRGGTQDAASDSDDRPKYWTEEELKPWNRWRRRVIV